MLTIPANKIQTSILSNVQQEILKLYATELAGNKCVLSYFLNRKT